jgi:hypothetical protein
LTKAQAANIKVGGGKLPTMTAGAIDRKIGKVAFGTSGKPHPQLVSPLKEQAPNPSLEPWPPCNCAETKAVNELRSGGAEMGNIDYHTVRTKSGASEVLCKNCEKTLNGASHIR